MDTLVFSHANGFPAALYEPLFAHWRAAGWRVLAVPRFGHDARYPVESGWRELRDQLTDYVDAHADGERVVYVGHSLGGALSLLAALKWPDLARAVIVLDAPVIAGWRAHTLHLAKRLGLIQRVGPGSVSRTRRNEWPSREAVHAHFASKPVFARWDPRMLAGYVEHGFEDLPDGRVALGFRREVETRLYNTLPHHMGTLLRRHPPRCPVYFLAGTHSEEMRQAGSSASRALAGQRFARIEGGHLYPMERPDETAAIVTGWLEEVRRATLAP